jgi:hypothetical protein
MTGRDSFVTERRSGRSLSEGRKPELRYGTFIKRKIAVIIGHFKISIVPIHMEA